MRDKGDPEIGVRMAEECCRLFPSDKDAERAIGVSGSAVKSWRSGGTPSVGYLQKMHYMGADAMYILTGKRTGEVGKEGKVNVSAV